VKIGGTTGDLLFVLLIGLGLLSWWAFIDLLSRKDGEWPTDGLSRLTWGFIVLTVPGLGALAYLVAGPPSRLGPRKRPG
jgi:hypothetical protein